MGLGSCEEATLCARSSVPGATISPPPAYRAIHLRPYLAARGDLTEILEAFVRTAREYCGIGATLYCYWRYAEHMAVAELTVCVRGVAGVFRRQAGGWLPGGASL